MKNGQSQEEVTVKVTGTISEIVSADEEIDFEGSITEDTQLKNLGINSLNIIKFIVKLEDEFEMEFEDDMLRRGKFETVGDLAEYIYKTLHNL